MPAFSRLRALAKRVRSCAERGPELRALCHVPDVRLSLIGVKIGNALSERNNSALPPISDIIACLSTRPRLADGSYCAITIMKFSAKQGDRT